MFEQNGTACIGVLDWELSTIGIHMPIWLLSSCSGSCLRARKVAGWRERTESLGIPSDKAFIADYCARRGLPDIDNFGFYLAFNFFRMASILQGVYKRAIDGNASNPERARAFGAYVPVFAQHGLSALKGK